MYNKNLILCIDGCKDTKYIKKITSEYNVDCIMNVQDNKEVSFIYLENKDVEDIILDLFPSFGSDIEFHVTDKHRNELSHFCKWWLLNYPTWDTEKSVAEGFSDMSVFYDVSEYTVDEYYYERAIDYGKIAEEIRVNQKEINEKVRALAQAVKLDRKKVLKDKIKNLFCR